MSSIGQDFQQSVDQPVIIMVTSMVAHPFRGQLNTAGKMIFFPVAIRPHINLEKFGEFSKLSKFSPSKILEMDEYLEVAARPFPNFGKLESLENMRRALCR